MKPSDIDGLSWDYGTPTYVREIEVKDEHIDIMGHTNNVVYVSWLEEAAWGHSQALGLNWEKYTELNRAMVAHRHEVDYLAATFCGDRLGPSGDGYLDHGKRQKTVAGSPLSAGSACGWSDGIARLY